MFWFFNHTSSSVDQPSLVHQQPVHGVEPKSNLAAVVPSGKGSQSVTPEQGTAGKQSIHNVKTQTQAPVENTTGSETNTSEALIALNTIGSSRLDQPEPAEAVIIRSADISSLPSSAESSAQAPSAFLSLGQYAASKLLTEEFADEYRKPDGKRHVGLAFTKAAATAFNRLSGRKIRVRENYDDRGELVSYAINSGSFEYERAIKK
jgi:hypothetical protein